MTLTEFLLARIAEDEAVAGAVQEKVRHGYVEDATGSAMTVYFDRDYLQGGANVSATRVLDECEAKRRVVAAFERAETGSSDYEKGYGLIVALRHLALPYADHPDYREEWRP